MWPCQSVWPGESGATVELGMFMAGPGHILSLSSGTWEHSVPAPESLSVVFEGTVSPFPEVLLSDTPEDGLLLGGPQKGTPDIM